MTLPENLPIFFVLYGRDSANTFALAAEGTLDARRARDELVAMGLGERSVVLASTDLRTQETAQIIGAGLRAQVLTGDDRFAWISDDPSRIRNLDGLLEEELWRQYPPLRADDVSGLTVVTGARLVGAVREITHPDTDPFDPVPHGGVVPYKPGTWFASGIRY